MDAYTGTMERDKRETATSDPAPAGLGAQRAGGELRGVKTGGRPETVSPFLRLELQLPSPCRRLIAVPLMVNESPRRVACTPTALRMIVLLQSLLRIFRRANVEPTPALAPQYVNEVGFPRDT